MDQGSSLSTIGIATAGACRGRRHQIVSITTILWHARTRPVHKLWSAGPQFSQSHYCSVLKPHAVSAIGLGHALRIFRTVLPRAMIRRGQAHRAAAGIGNRRSVKQFCWELHVVRTQTLAGGFVRECNSAWILQRICVLAWTGLFTHQARLALARAANLGAPGAPRFCARDEPESTTIVSLVVPRGLAFLPVYSVLRAARLINRLSAGKLSYRLSSLNHHDLAPAGTRYSVVMWTVSISSWQRAREGAVSATLSADCITSTIMV
ncbi:hypothetical protein M432DRAFT_314175 [Thermoascus aurantiacus ATCC 26904]